MKTRHQIITACVLAGFVLFLSSAGTAEQPAEKSAEPTKQAEPTEITEVVVTDERPASFWMEQKLRLSSEVLAGLAEGDFEKIAKNATVMGGLNRVESFVRREPEGYRDQLKQFNMANKALLRAASKENIEGATLAFNQLTVSCVSCHQQLRGE